MSKAPRTRSASVLVGTGILISRLSGLVRESVFGAVFGVGAVSDALGVATRVPNVLQMLLGEGTLSASFIPVYSAELERDEEEAGAIAGAVAALLALAAASIVVVSVVAAEPIAWVMAAGFRDEPHYDLAVTLLRIIFPAAGLLVLSAWCLGILNSHRRFFLSYVAPVLWNVAQVAAVVGAIALFGVGDLDQTLEQLADPAANVDALGDVATAAAWGFFAGAALQFLVQVPTVRRLARGLRFRPDPGRPGVREVIRRFGGAVLGRGVVQISALVDTFLAGLLVTGAIAALIKAQVLYILPISLFAISVAASELPELSRLDRVDDIRMRAQRGFSRILFFVSFVGIAYVMLGDKIVGTLYERGNFTADDSLLVWFVLGAYAIGLVPSAASRLTQNTLWSRGDTAGPARIAVVRVLLSVVVALAVMFVFDDVSTADVRDSVPTIDDAAGQRLDLRLGAVGITLGSALGAWVEALLLWRLARRHVPGVSPLAPLRDLAPAIAMAAAVALVGRIVTDDVWPPLAAAVSVGAAGVAYVGTARVRRVAEADLLLVGPLARFRSGA